MGDVDRALAAYHGHDRITAVDPTGRRGGDHRESVGRRPRRGRRRRAHARIAQRGRREPEPLRSHRRRCCWSTRRSGAVRSGLAYQRGDEVMTFSQRRSPRRPQRHAWCRRPRRPRPADDDGPVFHRESGRPSPPRPPHAGYLADAYACRRCTRPRDDVRSGVPARHHEPVPRTGLRRVSRGRLGNHIVTVGGNLSTTWKARHTCRRSSATASMSCGPDCRPAGHSNWRSISDRAAHFVDADCRPDPRAEAAAQMLGFGVCPRAIRN